jgi:hypothetical protein
MAEKLMKYYKYVSDEKGMVGKMQLAQLTKIPSTQAAIEPDTPDKIRLFRDAIAKLTGSPVPFL